MTLKRIVTQGLIDGFLGSVLASLEVVNDEQDLEYYKKEAQSFIPIPKPKVEEIDLALKTTRIKDDKDFIRIINKVYKEKHKRSSRFTTAVGIPDFLDFSFFSRGIGSGKAVCRILRRIDHEDDAAALSELVKTAIEGRCRIGNPFSIEEMAELLLFNDQRRDGFFKGCNDTNFDQAFTLQNIKEYLGGMLPAGTGFLVSENYLLTANHVIKEINLDKLVCEFLYEQNYQEENKTSQQINVERLVTSDDNLDYALIKLKDSAEEIGEKLQISAEEYPRLTEDDATISPPLSFKSEQELKKKHSNFLFEPAVEEMLEKARLLKTYKDGVDGLDGEPVTVIQHPRGDYKKIVVSSNRVINMSDDFIYYEADAEQGSSGSPLFNQAWQLVGLHRAYIAENNIVVGYEGVRTCKIAKHIRGKALNGELDSGLVNILLGDGLKSFESSI
ncbi:trypsin-like serine peptidase [Phormidium tenue]|jgi:V8-like Glu-specific endopeptidase|uniref:Trypsin-like peptidase domain-containing protein n=1 Tax=Phormidium tenue FACHB-1050 TaxID=2692857 RepID=A0ABR8C8N5_9CYAN|nr:serine protease [Phormidium tenue]MBD2316894.1 trypsin-like peptidase domain-containing protein [Phormidium tenue FACHB-1050]